MTSSPRTKKNAPDAGQGVEGSVPVHSKEHENMSSIPAPTHTVNHDLAPGTRVRHTGKGIVGTVVHRNPDELRQHPGMRKVQWDGDDTWLTNILYLEVLTDEFVATRDTLPAVVAPQIAEWNRFVDATDPIVDAGQPDPLGGYDCPAWCEAGRDVDGEHVHVVDVRGEQHESTKAHVLLSLYEGEDRQQYVRMPSLDVNVTATTRHPRPRPFIDVARTTTSGTTRVARMNVDEARALIRTLSAAVDLATGRDDWPDEPVPYALTGKAGL